MNEREFNNFLKGKKKIAFLLPLLLCCGNLFCQGMWKSNDGRTTAIYWRETVTLTDVAKFMAIIGSTDANQDLYPDGVESHILTKREVRRLSQEIFGDAIRALLDLDYGIASVVHPFGENASHIMKLDNGKFIVTTIASHYAGYEED